MEKEELKKEEKTVMDTRNKPIHPINIAIETYIKLGKGELLPEVLGLSKREYAAIHCLAGYVSSWANLSAETILKEVDALFDQLESTQKPKQS